METMMESIKDKPTKKGKKGGGKKGDKAVSPVKSGQITEEEVKEGKLYFLTNDRAIGERVQKLKVVAFRTESRRNSSLARAFVFATTCQNVICWVCFSYSLSFFTFSAINHRDTLSRTRHCTASQGYHILHVN
jgi:hypothetical protein